MLLYRRKPVIANKLHLLRRQRNFADYDTGITLSANDAESANGKLVNFGCYKKIHSPKKLWLAENEFGIGVIDDIKNAKNIDCVILTVAQDVFREITLDALKKNMNDSPILVDVRGMFDEEEVWERGFYYWSL